MQSSGQPNRSDGTPPLLLIWHRQRLFRECLSQVFTKSHNYRVMSFDGWGTPCENASARAAVCLVDAALEQEAVRVIRQIKQAGDAHVILLLPNQRDESLLECLSLGVHGCVLEEASFEELSEAVIKTREGHYYVPATLVSDLFPRLAELSTSRTTAFPQADHELTRREREILNYVSQGMSNRQISEKLDISVYTVKNHVHNLLEKMRVDNRHQAVAEARQKGWIASQ